MSSSIRHADISIAAAKFSLHGADKIVSYYSFAKCRCYNREARNATILTRQIPFEHIIKIWPSAAGLLSLMRFCDRQAIPEALVWRRNGGEDAEDRMKSSWSGDDELLDSNSDTGSDGGSDRGNSDVTLG